MVAFFRFMRTTSLCFWNFVIVCFTFFHWHSRAAKSTQWHPINVWKTCEIPRAFWIMLYPILSNIQIIIHILSYTVYFLFRSSKKSRFWWWTPAFPPFAAPGDAAPPAMAGTRALHPLKLRVRWGQAEHHVEAQPQDTVPGPGEAGKTREAWGVIRCRYEYIWICNVYI